MTESFSTPRETETKLKLPEFNVTAHISAPYRVTTKKCNDDVIFCRDLLRKLGIQLDFKNNSKNCKISTSL